MRSKTPKVLHKVAGNSLLGHVIDCALKLEPAQIQIIVGHGKELVIDELSDHQAIDRLKFVEQKQQLGTGDAMSHALPNIPDEANVLMLTADVPLIQDDTLRRLVASMQSHTLAVLTAIVDDPTGLGRITRDETDSVSGIIEEKDASVSQRQINEINSGIICAHKHRLSEWLDLVDNNNKQQEYYLTDVVKIAYADGDPITTLQPNKVYEVNGINDRVQLAAAERSFQRAKAEHFMQTGVTLIDPARVDFRGDINIGEDTIIDVNVVIEGTCNIGANVDIAPNCVIIDSEIADNVIVHANSVIENAKISQHCTIGPFARLRPGSQLAENVKIGNFVETKNAQLETGAKVNHLSYIGDADIGENTNIGAGVITCNYDGANKHKTKIGSNVFVGSDCQLVAPVTVDDDATIGAGSTVTADVSKGVLAISRAKQREINSWQRPVKKK